MKLGLAARIAKWLFMVVMWIFLYEAQVQALPDRVPSTVCFSGHTCERVIYLPKGP